MKFSDERYETKIFPKVNFKACRNMKLFGVHGIQNKFPTLRLYCTIKGLKVRPEL